MAVSNRYAEAAEHLRTFLKTYPSEPRAYQLLGLCLTETGELRGALAALETSYKLNPKDASILYSLAYANARAGDIDRAANSCDDPKPIPARPSSSRA